LRAAVIELFSVAAPASAGGVVVGGVLALVVYRILEVKVYS
jgi:hypothetical protein